MNENQMTLGVDYNGENPKGFFMSEKLDGCRAYWDGRTFWTRGGHVINAPAWLTAGLPRFALDGELWAGRGKLEVARRAVQYGDWDKAIRFMVFDLPGFVGRWPERMATAATLVQDAPCARPVAFTTIRDPREVFARLQEIHALGGEGLMLRAPFAPPHYEIGRSPHLLKVKAAHPAMMLLEWKRPARVRQNNLQPVAR